MRRLRPSKEASGGMADWIWCAAAGVRVSIISPS
jgi:hypothetical protein